MTTTPSMTDEVLDGSMKLPDVLPVLPLEGHGDLSLHHPASLGGARQKRPCSRPGPGREPHHHVGDPEGPYGRRSRGRRPSRLRDGRPDHADAQAAGRQDPHPGAGTEPRPDRPYRPDRATSESQDRTAGRAPLRRSGPGGGGPRPHGEGRPGHRREPRQDHLSRGDDHRCQPGGPGASGGSSRRQPGAES